MCSFIQNHSPSVCHEPGTVQGSRSRVGNRQAEGKENPVFMKLTEREETGKINNKNVQHGAWYELKQDKQAGEENRVCQEWVVRGHGPLPSPQLRSSHNQELIVKMPHSSLPPALCVCRRRLQCFSRSSRPDPASAHVLLPQGGSPGLPQLRGISPRPVLSPFPAL